MKKTAASFLLVMAAFIWGNGFVAQSVSMDYIGPWTFTCLRSLIAFITLVILSRGKDRITHSDGIVKDRRTLWIGGILCGIALGTASMLQQIGILYTTVGKAGFLTALYTVFVPVAGLFMGKKIRKIIWAAVILAVGGLYCLSWSGTFSFATGDVMLLLCALAFTCHIMVIDHFSPKTDAFKMSAIQFLTAGALCLIPMLVLEKPVLAEVVQAAVPILYAGVFSSGIAYTLQIIGQKNVEPAIASMILSLESVFAALSGFVLLHEVLTVRELIGCALIFTAIILAQLPQKESEQEF